MLSSQHKTTSGLLRLAQAASDSGVSRQTLEYYIMLGLVSPIRKPGNRGRWFDNELVKRVRLIRSLNDSGYTLRSIREIYLKKR